MAVPHEREVAARALERRRCGRSRCPQLHSGYSSARTTRTSSSSGRERPCHTRRGLPRRRPREQFGPAQQQWASRMPIRQSQRISFPIPTGKLAEPPCRATNECSHTRTASSTQPQMWLSPRPVPNTGWLRTGFEATNLPEHTRRSPQLDLHGRVSRDETAHGLIRDGDDVQVGDDVGRIERRSR